MRVFLLITGMLLTMASTVNAENVGTGTLSGEFFSSETETIETDPAMYGEFSGAYGESYTDTAGNPAYRWGVWTDSEGNFRWSDNNLSFSGYAFSEQAKGETFVAGTISYANGIAYIGSAPSSASLRLESVGDSLDFSQQLLIEIAIDSTPNQDSNGNPLSKEMAADFIYFPEFREFGSLRVFEGTAGTVEILTEFNSLHFKGFGEVLTPDTAFLSPSLTALPEPASAWLLWPGLLGMIGMARNKRKA